MYFALLGLWWGKYLVVVRVWFVGVFCFNYTTSGRKWDNFKVDFLDPHIEG